MNSGRAVPSACDIGNLPVRQTGTCDMGGGNCRAESSACDIGEVTIGQGAVVVLVLKRMYL